MTNPVALHIPLLAAHEGIWEGQYRTHSGRLVPREHALRRTTLMREHRSSHDAGPALAQFACRQLALNSALRIVATSWRSPSSLTTSRWSPRSK